VVLVGDGADEALLKYEGIEDADGFVTTTTSDEGNILMGAIGKALGARKSIAVVRREIFNRLEDYITVDAMVNPNEALASVIMRYIRYPSGASSLSIIDKIGAEVVEVTIPHDSSVVGKTIMNIGLPKGALLALLARDDDLVVPYGNTEIMGGDRVIIFSNSKILPKAVDMLGVR
jgi:trk system potassium uptake protein TrkA